MEFGKSPDVIGKDSIFGYIDTIKFLIIINFVYPVCRYYAFSMVIMWSSVLGHKTYLITYFVDWVLR